MTSDRARRVLAHALALTAAGAVACTTFTHGVTAELTYAADPVLGALPGEGGTLEPGRAVAVVSSVELLPCAEGADASLTPGSLGDALGPARARAHTEGPASLFGEPVVVDLLGGGAEVGVLAPPPGHYCQVRLTLAPADRDAVGLPEDIPVEGRSLVVHGVILPDGAASAPAALESSATATADLPLDPPLALEDPHAPAHLTVDLSLPRAVTGVPLTEPVLADRLLTALAATATATGI